MVVDPFVETAKEYFKHYGYWSIFCGVLLDNFGLPLPAETLIFVAGLFAAQGVLDLVTIILLGSIAAFIGWGASYAVGYYGGRHLLVQYGKFVFLNEKRIQALEDFVDRHGKRIIISARFLFILRQLGGFIAGVSKMPLSRFVPLNFVGALLWVGCWAAGPYYFVKEYDAVFGRFKYLGPCFLAALAAAPVLVIAYGFVKKRQKGKEHS
jgi:membrane protein DedA with SNARE-associated domain